MTRGTEHITNSYTGVSLISFFLILVLMGADAPDPASITGVWIQLGAHNQTGGLRLIDPDQTTQPAQRDGLLGRVDSSGQPLRFGVLHNFGLAAYGWYTLQLEVWAETLIEIEVQYALQGGGTSNVKLRTDKTKRWKTYQLTLPRAELRGKFDGADLIVFAPGALVRTVVLLEATPPQTRGLASGYYSPSIIPPPGLEVVFNPSSRHGTTLGSHLQFLKTQAEAVKPWGVRGILQTVTWNDIEPAQGAIEAERLRDIGRTYQQIGLSWWLQLELRTIKDAPPWYRDRFTPAQDLTTFQSASWPSRWDPAWLQAWNQFSRVVATQAQTIPSLSGIILDLRQPEAERLETSGQPNQLPESSLWAGDIHARRAWANSEYTFSLLPLDKIQSQKEQRLIQIWYERPRLEPLELVLETLNRLLPSTRVFLLLDEDDPLFSVLRDPLLTLALRYQAGLLLSVHETNAVSAPGWMIAGYETQARRIPLGLAIPQDRVHAISPSLALAALVEQHGAIMIMGEDDLEAPGAMERWSEATTLLQDRSENPPIAVALPALETLKSQSIWRDTVNAMRDRFPFDVTDTTPQSLLDNDYKIIIDLQDQPPPIAPIPAQEQAWNQWIEKGGTAIVYHPSAPNPDPSAPPNTAGQITTLGKGTQITLSPSLISLAQLPEILAQLISERLPGNGPHHDRSLVSKQDGVFTIHLSQQAVEVKTAEARVAPAE